jgi:hypothetical protein
MTGTAKTKSKLEALIEEGTVKLEGHDYLGLASDGVWVSLGEKGEEKILEKYFEDYPGPETW